MYELHFRVDIGMSALYRLFRVWNGCVLSMRHFYKLIIWSWGHLSSTSHSLLPSPWRSCFQVTLVLLIIKVSLTVFKNGRKMWHNGRSLEPLCTDMRMLSIFSSLCKKVNKHILQKHCLFNQLKLGYQLCHLHIEKSDVKSHFFFFLFIISWCRYSWAVTQSIAHLNCLLRSFDFLCLSDACFHTNKDIIAKFWDGGNLFCVFTFSNLAEDPCLSQAFCHLTSSWLLIVLNINHFYYSVTHLIQFLPC